MAFNVTAVEEFKKASDQGKGMGLAVAYFKKSYSILEKAKPICSLIPSNYLENFQHRIRNILSP